MLYRSYNKETKLAIAAMLSVFNNIVISRFDKNGNEIKKITVPCRYASESKIVKSIRNKDKALQLPIIAISRTGQERDMDRVCDLHKTFFTQGKLYSHSQIMDPKLSKGQREQRYYSYDFRRDQPQPINISFSVKIWAAYEEDLNQILSNFIPFFRPYIVVSSYHPYNKLEIIRNKIIWDGNIDNELPEDLDSGAPEEWKATVNFTYQTWFWFGSDKDKFTATTSLIENINTGPQIVGNINNGDKPTGSQWVDDHGNIWQGRDTGKNINDGDDAGEDEFIDPYTGEIYYRDSLHVYGNLKEGFFIGLPSQTIERLTELIDRAQTHEELPYHEHVIDYGITQIKEAESIPEYPFIDHPDQSL